MNSFNSILSSITAINPAIESRSICAENFTGEKGKGGMATEGTGQGCARDLGQGWKVSPSVVVKAGETFTLGEINGQGKVTHMWFTYQKTNTVRPFIFRIYWDDSPVPSVEAPLTDFFACTDTRSYAPLTSLPVCVNPANALNCYWEMPFYKNAKFTIENITEEDLTVYYQIDYLLCELPESCGYFHAQFRRTNPLPYKEVYTITDNIEGCGQYIGTYMFWGVNNCSWWGEGEIKFYIDDDKEFPTICGTGTEDYFCGSYNFDVSEKYTEFSTPYSGLSKVIRPDGLYSSQQRFSLYRWHLTDPIYFKKNLKVTIQALGWRSGGRYLPLQDDISSVCFWYQDKPAKNMPKLPTVDELEVI